ncbi:MAG TPA: ABC transporter substrate-binding protein [Candidatus Binatia bacterium]|nr:ABC transporter substrate-binding protein [Candidatus Binatia bacterium]
MKRLDFAVGLSSVPAVVATSRWAAESQELTTVFNGHLGIATDAPLWIADQKGYFRDQGIKIEYVKFTSSEEMMPLLSTGKLDIGNGAPGAALYNAVLRGIDVRAVADAATDPPGYGWSKLLIRADLLRSGRFKTIRDLKGMQIAGAATASSSSPQVARLVAMAGLKYSDITRLVLPYPQHPIALQNGAIEAALTIEPFATLAVDRGVAVAIMGNDRFYPNQEVSCLLCSASLISSRRDLIVRYLRGYLRGVRFYEDSLAGGRIAGQNADEVVNVIATHTGLNETLIRRTTPVSIDPNGRLNVASMRDDLVFYKDQGYVKGDITSEAVVDTTLSPEALKTIGVYRRRV